MLALLATLAVAQEVPVTIGNVQVFHPSVDARQGLLTDDAALRPDGYLGVKTLMSYTYRPLVFRFNDDTVRTVVGGVWQGDVIGSFTWARTRFALDVPLLFGGPSDLIPEGRAGLGDIALDVKYTLLDPDKKLLGLGGSARLTLPTNTVQTPLGDQTPTIEFALIGDFEVGPVLVAANAGTRIGARTEVGPVEVRDQFTLRLGAGYPLTEDLGVSAELAGRAAYKAPIADGAPLELLAGAWAWLTEDFVVRAGAGFGVGRAVGTPGARVLLGLAYEPPRDRTPPWMANSTGSTPAPRFDDADSDGIADDIDACIREAEDIDNYEDDDGCPEAVTLLGVRLQDSTGATAQGATAEVTCLDFKKDVSADQSLVVPSGTCTLVVSGQAWTTTAQTMRIRDGEPIEKVIELTPRAAIGHVQAVVVDPTGQRVPQAAWSFGSGPFTRIHGGQGVSAVVPGNYSVRVGGKGFRLQTVQVTVVAGEKRIVKVRLVPE